MGAAVGGRSGAEVRVDTPKRDVLTSGFDWTTDSMNQAAARPLDRAMRLAQGRGVLVLLLPGLLLLTGSRRGGLANA